jgi:NADH-quinone oxidoreductase subunit L
MIFPLRVLAVLSFIGGWIGLENVFNLQFAPAGKPHDLSLAQQMIAPLVHAPVPASFGLLAAVVGAWAAYNLYAHASKDPLPERLGVLSQWMRNRFYFDELYQATLIRFHDSLAAIAAWIDRWLIAGLAVRGTHGTTELIGRALRQFQTGNLQTYAFLFALGVAFLLYFVLK